MDGYELNRKITPREHRLANGLRVLIREDHAVPVVAIVTYVKAGYFDEPDDLVGVSHVLEHMYFKGTERRGVGEIARATKAAGGYLNAGTIYDHTSYYTVLPAGALEMGLDIQADALIRSRIDGDELEKELEVIIQEVNRKRDNPGALAAETLYETLFDVHPMRRWRMGTEDELRRMTRDDVVGYYRDMYRASNITLVVSGDVDADRAIRHAESLYADLPPGAPERGARSEPERSGARLREMEGDIAHTYGELGWRTPGSLDPDTPALDAMAGVLGQGRASRLYLGVRERGLVSGIDAYNYTPSEIGVFGISLECEPERTEAALQAAWREVARIRDEGIADHELDRVRTLMVARLLRRLETVEGQANLLAEWQAQGDWREAGAYLDRVRALTPDDIRRVARRYLAPDRIAALVYRPAGETALGWSDEALPDRLAEGTGPEPEPAASSSIAPVVRPVTLGTPSGSEGVVQYEMGGGRLVVKPRARAPLVSMAVFRRGGVVREGPESAGITGLTMRASLKGSTSRSAERIAVESERLGGALRAGAGADLLSWSFTVPAENFDDGMALLADVALNPTFPEAEVARERDVLLADLDRLRDDMYRYPLRLLFQAAFDGHPYGYGPDMVERAVREVVPGTLRSWHESRLGDPWVFVVGDVDAERVADRVQRLFGIPASGDSPSDPGVEWPQSGRAERVRRDRAQTALALGFPGPDRNHPDEPAVRVLMNAVSGLGNRLFEELRSRRSLAYSVAAYPISRFLAGMVVGYIATSPERADEARQGLMAELVGLRDEPPSEEELERARRYTIGAWRIGTQTNAAQLAELATALMLGNGLEEIRTFEERVQAVGREQARDAARRWLDPDRVVEGAVLGRD